MQKGERVKWKWGNGYGRGEIVETYDHEVTKTINGEEITRKGQSGNRALLIKQKDDSRVLKLEQEVSSD